MKKLLAIALFSQAAIAEVTHMEVFMGGITMHIIGNEKPLASKYENKLNDRGIIANPLGGIRLKDKLPGKSIRVYTLLVGRNSINEKMIGGTWSFGKEDSVGFLKYQLLGTLGGYFQNIKKFHERGIKMPSFGNFMPIVGGEFNIYLFEYNDTYVKLNNFVSPLVTLHNISAGMKF